MKEENLTVNGLRWPSGAEASISVRRLLQSHLTDFLKVEFGLTSRQLQAYRTAKTIWDRNDALQRILQDHAQCEEIKHYIEGMSHMVEAFDDANCIGVYA
jgi:hypothetical protein|tara:strand:+ start:181 stop:480 length:300 start_codon:yes stop_codon:yes gene_type:complete